MTDRVPIEALMRADVPQQEPRVQWQRVHSHNLSILGMYLAGVPIEDIARRHSIAINSAYVVARRHAILRFRRVSGPRTRILNRPQFWDNVDKAPGGCWEWMGSGRGRGYGQWHSRPAHRVALETYLGRALRHGEYACHHCDNPPCVRPDHLYAGSAQENSRDASRRGRLTGFRDHWADGTD